MENESIDVIGVRYSLEDLKREDVCSLLSYVDIVNKLLEIVIPIVGIERCRSILTKLISDYEILEGSQITNEGIFIHPEAITVLIKHGELVGSGIVLGGFNIFIATILETFGFMSSSQLSTAAIISAASEVGKERLKVIEASNTELENKVQVRTAELQKSNEQLSLEVDERKRVEERIIYVNRLYSILSNVNQAIVRIRDQQELFQEICRITVEEGLFRMAWVGLVDADTFLVRQVAHWGVEEGYLDKIVISTKDISEGQELTGIAIREEKCSICNDIEQVLQLFSWREEALKRGYYSCVAFPINIDSQVIGAFTIYASKKGLFDDQKLRLLHELSIDISFALEHMEEEKKRKLAEAELLLAYEQVKTTQSQLVQSAKMASVGLLAGGVAHEINNPLTGVLNNVQLIKMMVEQKKDFSRDDFKDLLNVIEESAKRCTKITHSLLDFSHASKGVFQNLKLDEVVEKAVVLVEEELKLENINIQKKLGAGQAQIFGDFQLLEQAIFDLIANARWAIEKKSGRGGGSIIIKTAYDPEAKQVILYVSDTGMGITKENLERIFEPFFTTKAVGEGTGLGLSIVYGIIKEHQGNIEVESQENKGTTFKISMPVV